MTEPLSALNGNRGHRFYHSGGSKNNETLVAYLDIPQQVYRQGKWVDIREHNARIVEQRGIKGHKASQIIHKKPLDQVSKVG